MRLASLGLVAFALAFAQPAFAQSPEAPDSGSSKAYEEGAGTWGVDQAITAASLARDGWKFLSGSTMSWPDGSQVLVTIWLSELGDHARCFGYFTPVLEPAGGRCERTGHGL